MVDCVVRKIHRVDIKTQLLEQGAGENEQNAENAEKQSPLAPAAIFGDISGQKQNQCGQHIQNCELEGLGHENNSEPISSEHDNAKTSDLATPRTIEAEF